MDQAQPPNFSPPSQVPRKEAGHIYDIKYFNRDQRRAGTIGGTRQEVLVVQSCGKEALPHVPLKDGVPPPPGPAVKHNTRPG